MAEFKNPIVKLNNNNYTTWKYKMELLLIKENLWDEVMKDPDENKIRNADDTSDTSDNSDDDNSTVLSVVSSAKWIKKDNKARAMIGLMVEDDQLVHIRNEKTALSSWKALQKYHQKHTLSNKVHLIRSICSLKLEENGDVQKHINKLTDLFQKLRDINENELSESWEVAMLLSSLSTEYDTLITALEARKEKDLTFAFVQEKILAEYERRIKGRKTSELGSAMVTTSDVFLCHFCKKEGHFKKDCAKYKIWLTKQSGKGHGANISKVQEFSEINNHYVL